MDTIKELRIIDEYVYNLYKNQEVSQDETINFLHTYSDYILKINGIPPKYFTVDIFITKDMSDDHLAEMGQDPKNGSRYEIYLRKGSLNAKNTNDIDKIFLTMIDFGHEMEHVVQYITHPKTIVKFFRTEANLEKVYNTTIVRKMLSRKNEVKFKKAMITYDKALHLTTRTEKSADNQSYAYLLDLLEQSINTHPHDIGYINFILEYANKIAFDKSERKKQYQHFYEAYLKSRKVLQKQYNIKKENLIIP